MKIARRHLGTGVLLVVLAAIGAAYLYAQHLRQQREARDLERALAVEHLPPWIKSQWFGFIDRRIAAAIRPEGGSIRVEGHLDHILKRTSYVSRNTPYELSCDSLLGITVRFGYGDDAVPVVIYRRTQINRNAEKPPELGVHPRSIAALRLYEETCGHVAKRIDALLGH